MSVDVKYQPGDVPFVKRDGQLAPCEDYFADWAEDFNLTDNHRRELTVRQHMTRPHSGWFDGQGVSMEEQAKFYRTLQYRSSDQTGPCRLPVPPKFQGIGLSRPKWASPDTFPFVHIEDDGELPQLMWTTAAWKF